MSRIHGRPLGVLREARERTRITKLIQRSMIFTHLAFKIVNRRKTFSNFYLHYFYYEIKITKTPSSFHGTEQRDKNPIMDDKLRVISASWKHRTAKRRNHSVETNRVTNNNQNIDTCNKTCQQQEPNSNLLTCTKFLFITLGIMQICLPMTRSIKKGGEGEGEGSWTRICWRLEQDKKQVETDLPLVPLAVWMICSKHRPNSSRIIFSVTAWDFPTWW